MIDQDKMRALAAKLHATSKQLIAEMKCGELTMANPHTLNEAADAIDLLLAEVEAAAADKRDAKRYRWLRDNAQPSYLMMATINEGTPSLCRRELLTIDAQSWQALDQHIDAALAQRQGEGS
ncbi:hypothetical protein QZM42_33530 [Burkholderia vietnamiensis]|uniref:hypothetical protein n=1 Tax=Burkholderia vietnamiensis TaxID=60552 RepID=UPI00264F8661|nr:hypothetical protein [Burkholderia vietnamiensis]MDN7413449.1 hypothetical protein [Burkholderia vietnamiensis]